MSEHEISADVLTAIEACRPDSDDAVLPEVAAMLDREPPERVAALRKSVARVDRAIVAATHKLPVPEGLADRILASLPAARDTGCIEAAQQIAGTPVIPVVRLKRRRWMAAGAGFALAASLLIAVGLWFTRGTIHAEQLEADARGIYADDDHQADLATGEAPLVVPGLTANAVIGWRTATMLNRQTVVYELAGRRGIRATVYVLPLRSLWGPKLENLRTGPVPQSTAGTTIAVWADDSHAYVMVVKGSERDFWSFFSRNVAA